MWGPQKGGGTLRSAPLEAYGTEPAFGWVFTLRLSPFNEGLSAITASLHHHHLHHHNMAMHIRVKRKKTTYFVHCEPSDTVLQVKNKLEALTDSPASNQRLILMDSHHVLDDGQTLAQQQVENNSIIALTLKKNRSRLFSWSHSMTFLIIVAKLSFYRYFPTCLEFVILFLIIS
ncbi:hypothetical protein GOP47_0003812 [Adiantum capillus-veneris]|uniref:Ubiquitin-like domain-containing protein n=1 Tax=Adiantum capillus-veneris TaxID=13818 RepID=A0A9D4V6U9_ADICA|nr:hypothetical protein GOP47_0003812 [Adiantum capillus-veneris]